jgi:NAD(P)-dependent dehydrogenase (short-subunit alcohol dehydrogenase family)
MAEAPTLASVRILVVGASSGIGRAFSRHAIGQRGRVCVVGRRADKLRDLCTEAAGGHPVVGDVTDPDDCRRLVDDAAALLGGFDLVLYAAGAGTMAPIIDTDAEAWRFDHAVNVLGPTLVCGAALPHLAADGLVTFVSSESASETRWGMSSYASSKAALDATIRAWRMEHPERRFQQVVMGATIPTDFGNSFDSQLLGTAMERWVASGTSMAWMETEDVGRHLAELAAVFLAHPKIDVPTLRFAPRGQAWA